MVAGEDTEVPGGVTPPEGRRGQGVAHRRTGRVVVYPSEERFRRTYSVRPGACGAAHADPTVDKFLARLCHMWPEEQKADAAALDWFAREGLEYAHGLAVWFCVTRLGVVADALPAFELPPEVTLDRVCGDAIVRDEREAVYFLGSHYKRLAVDARAEKADDRYSGLMNPSYPHEVDAVYWFPRASRLHLHAGATLVRSALPATMPPRAGRSAPAAPCRARGTAPARR